MVSAYARAPKNVKSVRPSIKIVNEHANLEDIMVPLSEKMYWVLGAEIWKPGPPAGQGTAASISFTALWPRSPIASADSIVARQRYDFLVCHVSTASLSAIRHTPVANGAVPISIEL